MECKGECKKTVRRPLQLSRQERMMLCFAHIPLVHKYTAISSVSLDPITPTSYCLTSLLLFATSVLQRAVYIHGVQFLCSHSLFNLSHSCFGATTPPKLLLSGSCMASMLLHSVIHSLSYPSAVRVTRYSCAGCVCTRCLEKGMGSGGEI